VVIGTACIVCSVYVTVWCPSICLSLCLIVPSFGRCCGFAAVGPACGDIDRLLHGRRSAAATPQLNAQQQMSRELHEADATGMQVSLDSYPGVYWQLLCSD